MQRNISIDIMKGIAILLVVVGHCYLVPEVPWKKIIYSFHMPLFFLVAGYFYHRRNIKESFKKDFKRLLVPYICFAGFVFILDIIHALRYNELFFIIKSMMKFVWCSEGAHHTSILFNDVPGVGMMWFLPAMFWCKNLYNIIFIYCSTNNKYLLILLISLFAIFLDRFLINMPMAFLVGCSAMFFFMIGNLSNEHKCPICIIPLLLVSWIISVMFGHVWMSSCNYKIYPVDVAGACGGTMIVYLTSRYLCNVPFINTCFAWCGKNSMSIFCVHFLNSHFFIVHRLIQADKWWTFLLTEFLFIIPVSYLLSLNKYTRTVVGC